MPSPPTAASLPVQNLLSQLSSEFERLQKQNEDLARENLQLHAAFIGTGSPCSTALCANGDESNKALALHSKCNCLAPRVLTESPLRDGKMSLEADSAKDVEAALKAFGDSCQLRDVRDVFDELDVHHVGMLYLQDLVHIMRSAGKTIEPHILVNAVRASNDEEPICFDAHDIRDELTDAERFMRVDLRAFSRLLDGSLERGDRLGSGAAACLEGLREACCQRAASSGRRKELGYCAPRPDDGDEPSAPKRQRVRYEAIPAVVIFLNMILTGLSIDNPAHEEIWEAAETVFACWYLLEFLVKLRMLGCRGYFWGAEFAWNWFDIGCLLVSFIDPTVKVLILTVWKDGERPDLSALMMIKMFRLARLARLVRILRFKIFHELKIMILGVFSGLRVLTWAIVLLVMLTYLVGVGMTYLVGPYEPEFRTVSQAMLTLFRCWTEGCAAYDGTPLVERLREKYGYTVMVFYILITMFVTVGVFNLIMAIFIDNVLAEQNTKKHKEIAERSSDIELKLRKLITDFLTGRQKKRDPKRSTFTVFGQPSMKVSDRQRVEEDWDNLRKRRVSITRSAFKQLLQSQEFARVLDEAEIESSNHFELFDVLDSDMGGQLSMDELTTGLMKLRGPVTKADIVAVRLKVRHLTMMLENA